MGITQLVVNVDYDDNDDKMTKDYINELSEMFERAGFKNIKSRDNFKKTWKWYPWNGRGKNG